MGTQKKSKLSWTKTLVKKWFSTKSKGDFQPDGDFSEGGDEGWTSNFFEREACTIKKSRKERLGRMNSDRIWRSNMNLETPQVTDVNTNRIFVATWNVGGKSPPSYLNLEDWLHTSPPADIYVLGFQEIVPLNAGNVLGTEDNGPARKWLMLIRNTLNNLPSTNPRCPSPSSILEPNRQKSSSFRRCSFQSSSLSMPQPRLDPRFSVCDHVMLGQRPNEEDSSFTWCYSSDEENDYEPGDYFSGTTSYLPTSSCEFMSTENADGQRGKSRYCLVASKQMVGIFLTIWVKSDMRDHVRNLKVSCVGRGLMGYLGNKGSISISMSLHLTSFCFICSHLTSGQKEGDELRRNSDVMEILRKTRFPRIHDTGDENSPQTILEHDRIIWLGDLNYRIALSYRAAKALVEMRNWRALLENDQLRIEQRRGRVFEGWNEGKIYFPPTYKYLNNSDRYAGDDIYSKEKRRTPAWCDRILWYGKGLQQMSYVRGESRFSDHRPVYSLFLAEVESVDQSRIRKTMSCSRIEVEELLPQLDGYTDRNFF
ncbi:hypothetical protein NMG60_11014011 [Bertholletia excelsa]